jgi:hypothetical protein
MEMMPLGTFIGQGTAIVGHKQYERISYCISVSETNSLKSGAGRIEMASMHDAMDVFRSGTLTLELRTGDRVDLIGLEAIEPSTVIEVRTVGPIPGY